MAQHNTGVASQVARRGKSGMRREECCTAGVEGHSPESGRGEADEIRDGLLREMLAVTREGGV
jgi:hypothetical protein